MKIEQAAIAFGIILALSVGSGTWLFRYQPLTSTPELATTIVLWDRLAHRVCVSSYLSEGAISCSPDDMERAFTPPQKASALTPERENALAKVLGWEVCRGAEAVRRMRTAGVPETRIAEFFADKRLIAQRAGYSNQEMDACFGGSPYLP